MSLLRISGLLSVVLFFSACPCRSQVQGGAQAEIREHSQKAQKFLQEKRPDLAIPELQALIALDPNNADALANLGVLLFFRGEYAAAAPHLRSALTQKPDLWKIQALLGMCEARMGDSSSARADLESAFPHLPGDKTQFEVGNELIDSYSSSGDLDKADSIVSVLRSQHPDDASLLYTAYRLYSDLAGEAMLTLSLTAPNSAQMHQVMAHELARQDNRVAAIAQYREALKTDPTLPGIHFELAEALNTTQAGGDAEEALAEYKAAVAVNAHDEKAECRLGELAANRGDVQESYMHYQRATKLQPSDSEAAIGLAKALTSMDQPEKAIPLLEHAIEVDPTSALAYFRLSALYRRVGRKEDAERALEQFKKYKAMKEKLTDIYKQMHVEPVRQESTEADAGR